MVFHPVNWGVLFVLPFSRVGFPAAARLGNAVKIKMMEKHLVPTLFHIF